MILKPSASCSSRVSRSNPNSYWTRGLANLGSLPPVEGFPRYGYLIDADDAAAGRPFDHHE